MNSYRPFLTIRRTLQICDMRLECGMPSIAPPLCFSFWHSTDECAVDHFILPLWDHHEAY